MLKLMVSQFKPYLADVEKNAEKHYQIIEEAVSADCNLVVFPELSMAGYDLRDAVSDVALDPGSEIIRRIKEYSRDISIVFGFVYEEQPGCFYNAAAYVEQGKILNIHKKVFLPTYGLFDEKRYFSEGSSFSFFDTKFFRGSILICEDALHADSLIHIAENNVDMVFIPAGSPLRGIGENGFYAEKVWNYTCGYISTNMTCTVVFANRAGVEGGVTFWGGSKVYKAGGGIECSLPFLQEDKCISTLNKADIREERIKNPLVLKDKSKILYKTIMT